MRRRDLIGLLVTVLVVSIDVRGQVPLRHVTLVRDRLAITIVHGFTSDGSMTGAWREAVKHRYTEAALDSLSTVIRHMDSPERAWRDMIVERSRVWELSVDSLRVPFGNTRPPDAVTIILGLHGGNDAFVNGPSTICFDLGRLQKEYGNAGSGSNGSRIDRFFAHEFTHLIHKAWAREHPVRLESPLDNALWDCLVEGIGNYRSLTARWVAPDGQLTDHARRTLDRLEPVFVDRITALASASDEEAPRLLEGLSDGRFDRKWGALTVALWLAREAQGDDRRLKPWIDAGPEGILDLASRHLSADLRSRLPKRL